MHVELKMPLAQSMQCTGQRTGPVHSERLPSLSMASTREPVGKCFCSGGQPPSPPHSMPRCPTVCSQTVVSETCTMCAPAASMRRRVKSWCATNCGARPKSWGSLPGNLLEQPWHPHDLCWGYVPIQPPLPHCPQHKSPKMQACGQVSLSKHGWNASMETRGQGACGHLGVTCCNGWKHNGVKE